MSYSISDNSEPRSKQCLFYAEVNSSIKLLQQMTIKYDRKQFEIRSQKQEFPAYICKLFSHDSGACIDLNYRKCAC